MSKPMTEKESGFLLMPDDFRMFITQRSDGFQNEDIFTRFSVGRLIFHDTPCILETFYFSEIFVDYKINLKNVRILMALRGINLL